MTERTHCAWLETEWPRLEVDGLSLVFHKRPIPSDASELVSQLVF